MCHGSYSGLHFAHRDEGKNYNLICSRITWKEIEPIHMPYLKLKGHMYTSAVIGGNPQEADSDHDQCMLGQPCAGVIRVYAKLCSNERV